MLVTEELMTEELIDRGVNYLHSWIAPLLH